MSLIYKYKRTIKNINPCRKWTNKNLNVCRKWTIKKSKRLKGQLKNLTVCL